MECLREKAEAFQSTMQLSNFSSFMNVSKQPCMSYLFISHGAIFDLNYES